MAIRQEGTPGPTGEAWPTIHGAIEPQQRIANPNRYLVNADATSPSDFSVWKTIAATEQENCAREMRKRFERRHELALLQLIH